MARHVNTGRLSGDTATLANHAPRVSLVYTSTRTQTRVRMSASMSEWIGDRPLKEENLLTTNPSRLMVMCPP